MAVTNNKTAGEMLLKIKSDWDDNFGEGPTFEDAIKECFSCSVASIDAAGDVWIADPPHGKWLDETAKEMLVQWLKANDYA